MHKKVILLFVLFSMVGCSQTNNPDVEILLEIPPTITALPAETAIPEPTTIPPTPTREYISQICSPLEGDEIKELSEIITQPYKQPRPGIDNGDTHHGVDFAYFRRKERLSIDGVSVLAAIEGTVAAIINDRFPYGNAIIIETPLSMIDPNLPLIKNLPERLPIVLPDPKMVHCQSDPMVLPLNDNEESLYIMYSHFQNPVTLEIGERVQCGQVIGVVGNSGDSSNPHLHFETRIGPSGARFESMAYYIADATQTERINYCIWRVTNQFQVFDPLLFIDQ